MATNKQVKNLIEQSYTAGFVTDIESDQLPIGLNEETVIAISKKKNEPEFMTKWRLEAYNHWKGVKMPNWAHLDIDPIDFQAICYYSDPKSTKIKSQSLD